MEAPKIGFDGRATSFSRPLIFEFCNTIEGGADITNRSRHVCFWTRRNSPAANYRIARAITQLLIRPPDYANAHANAHEQFVLGATERSDEAIDSRECLLGLTDEVLVEIHCEVRGAYSRTCTSFAASISVRANHWPCLVNRTEPCRRFVITANMPSRARSATVTPEMCLPSGAPHQQPLRLSRPLLLKHSIKTVRLASERRPTGARGLVAMNGGSARVEVIVASFLPSRCTSGFFIVLAPD